MILTEKKTLIYASINLILLLINSVFFVLQFSNPLTNFWLMVVYFGISIIAGIFFIYTIIKVVIKRVAIYKKTLLYILFDWLSFILIAISIFVMIFGNFIMRGVVQGQSMEPTLSNKQSIFIYKFQVDPEVDDIVIIKHKNKRTNKNEIIIKRIVAGPGDEIYFERRPSLDSERGFAFNFYINDEIYKYITPEGTLEEAVIYFDDFRKLFQTKGAQLTIRQKDGSYLSTIFDDYYFVLGDNFENSLDSRVHGLFHISEIGGKLIYAVGGLGQ